ncbi:YdeI/OmpD-associated family protein [Modestobacter roseus]|uniref:Bacteriocin resistance YdeI/OmpD-like protein n=2 Tax=Modestobacter roseus TaxID=1181884 RepID=A0A562IXR1_9ACTN|nr:YdeI/OmpD-associated family protein [Modestobacter roseus]TWH75757.1 bacteriocin resistance YdeI/OmpD-like protein [Modestobacter roseus]
MLWFSPRQAGSAWSRPNKQRIAELEEAGLLTPSGRATVERARADGSWSRLDEVEDLVVPADLSAAFDAIPEAREQWAGFPPSARRAILEWIVQARRPETRARRVAETARLAARGERANQWRKR